MTLPLQFAGKSAALKSLTLYCVYHVTCQDTTWL